MVSQMITTNLPTKYIFIVVGFGMVGGAIAGLANLIYGLPFIFIVGGSRSLFLLAVACIVAPIVEELCKPIGLYLIHTEEHPLLTIWCWLRLGMCAGLGFGLLENLIYTINGFIIGGLFVGVLILILRTLLSLPLHMLTTSIAGIGFGLWNRTLKAEYFGLALAISIIIHSMFNFTAIMLGPP